MEDIPKPIEVGFAEFIAKLVSEVFDAVVTSQFDQEKRIAELSAAAGLPLEEFAKNFVTDEQTMEELERLFPGDSDKHSTAIYVGAPYRPKKDGVSELPPIHAILGITLQKGDYRIIKKQTVLTSSGVKKVKAAVRQHLAKEHQSAVNEIIRRGLPRVIADAGRVNAKLTYEVLSLQDNEKLEKAVCRYHDLYNSIDTYCGHLCCKGTKGNRLETGAHPTACRGRYHRFWSNEIFRASDQKD